MLEAKPGEGGHMSDEIERIASRLRAAGIKPGTGSSQRWCLRFSDPDLRGSLRPLGACLVRADDLQTAEEWATMNGCHFGGEVEAEMVPDWLEIPETFYDRPLSRAEVEELERLIA